MRRWPQAADDCNQITEKQSDYPRLSLGAAAAR
jgi:hypothetical protein